MTFKTETRSQFEALLSELGKRESAEIIEAKTDALNRSAIGQVIVGAWWLKKKKNVETKMTIVCGRGQEFLQDFCGEKGIRVWTPNHKQDSRDN